VAEEEKPAQPEEDAKLLAELLKARRSRETKRKEKKGES